MGTYLSHDLAEGHLFEVSGLATHVWACDYNKVASLRDMAVVGNGLLASNALQDWMAALSHCQRIREFRAHWGTNTVKFIIV